MNNDYCMIETAFKNKDELNKTIEYLIDKKLVASCQIVSSNSTWNWKGKKESSEEYLVFMKTIKKYAEEIYSYIKSIHSYECFEFAMFDMTSINFDYLHWIEKETK